MTSFKDFASVRRKHIHTYRSFLKTIEFIHDPTDTYLAKKDPNSQLLKKKLEDWNTFSNALEVFGWKHIGEGLYATVWSHKNYPYVIKFFHNEDQAYRYWWNICVKMQNNVFIPKMKGKILSISPIISAVRIEKLNWIDEGIATKLVEWVLSYGRLKERNQPVIPADFPWKQYEDQYIAVLEALWDKKNPFGLDPSKENFMVRPGQSIPVFTDPLS